jgi:regulator of replication initiation timing
MEYRQGASTPTARRLLMDRLTALRTRLRRLSARTDELESERDRLRKENRALRQRLTHAQLADDVLRQAAAVAEDDAASPAPATPVRRLYEALPDIVSFSAFFRRAEREGLDADPARRCLRHLLARGLLVQDGGQLTKPDRRPETA